MAAWSKQKRGAIESSRVDFGSVAEAVAFAEAHPTDLHATSHAVDNASWSGSASFDQAREHSTGNGWDLTQRVEMALQKVTPLLAKVDTRRTVQQSAVCGGSWVPARVNSRHPLAARVSKRVNTEAPKRLVKVLVNGTVSGSVDKSKITEMGVALVALVEACRRGGVAVEVFNVHCVNDAYLSGAKREAVVVTRCAAAGVGKIDPAPMLFALAHPSMLRRVFFGAMEHFTDSRRRAFMVGTGYGYCAKTPQWLVDEIAPTITIDAVQVGAGVPNPEAWLRAHLAKCGVVLTD